MPEQLDLHKLREIPVTPPPAADVRRRGDQRRRRARALTAAAAVAAIVLVVVPTTLVLHGKTDGSAPPVGPGRAPVTKIQPGFPIDAGIDQKGGVKKGPSRKTAGVTTSDECADRLWPNDAATPSDRLAVTVSGPWGSQGRDLRVYVDEKTAARTWGNLQDSVGDCTSASGYTWKVLHPDTGYDSITVGMASADGRPDGAIYQFTKVGNAIFAVSDAGEYVLRTLPADGGDATVATRKVAPAMCVFSKRGCGVEGSRMLPPTGRRLTMQGYGDLRLHETVAQTTGSKTLVDVYAPEGTSCGTFQLVRSPGGDSEGYISPKHGVVAISAVPRMGTEAGIQLGSTLADVRKAYPDLKKNDSGYWIHEDARYPDRSLEFGVESDGTVTEISLVAKDQDCFG